MAASSPQFFRIILQRDLEEPKMMIPKKFVKHYGKLLSNSIILKLPDGMEWKVGLTTAANGVVRLQEGWLKFAENYCLKFGSLLVFRFDGSSTFHTTIFDPTGVETEYCCNFNDSQGEFEEDVDDDDEVSNGSAEGFNLHSKRRKKTFVSCRQSRQKMRNDGLLSLKIEPEEEECINFRDMPSSRKRMTKHEVGISRRRQQLANKAVPTQRFSSKSEEQPAFKIVMSRSNVGGRFNMIIPKKFAETYLSDDFGVIKLQTSNGRTWPLLYKWSRTRGNFAYISSGWKHFAEQNLLKEGDVGFFQSIKKHKFLFTKLRETSPSHSPSPKKRAAATTRNPFFEVDILFKTYKNATLNIPMAFAKEHFSPKMSAARLQVGNKQWDVKLKQYKSCVRFSSGWSTFYGDNGLEDRDTCLFEMVNKELYVFRVTIFKKVTTTSSSSMD